MVMTPGDQAFIGGISGTVEVLLMQPTVAIKNAVQEGRPISWNPLHMYRGLGVCFLISCSPRIHRRPGMACCVPRSQARH